MFQWLELSRFVTFDPKKLFFLFLRKIEKIIFIEQVVQGSKNTMWHTETNLKVPVTCFTVSVKSYSVQPRKNFKIAFLVCLLRLSWELKITDASKRQKIKKKFVGTSLLSWLFFNIGWALLTTASVPNSRLFQVWHFGRFCNLMEIKNHSIRLMLAIDTIWIWSNRPNGGLRFLVWHGEMHLNFGHLENRISGYCLILTQVVNIVNIYELRN